VKFKMAKNSLFATLLRSPWWISMVIALLLSLLGYALLPEHLRSAGALSGLPFAVIGVMALVKQWGEPGAARIEQVQQSLATLAWPAFAQLLEQAFRRDGYTVRPSRSAGVDFELEREGQRTLVSARRWKSARSGLEALRPLQTARLADGTAEAIYICLAPLSDNAAPFAAEHGIQVWRAAALAKALRGLPLVPAQAA
jgi:restriction system protein